MARINAKIIKAIKNIGKYRMLNGRMFRPMKKGQMRYVPEKEADWLVQATKQAVVIKGSKGWFKDTKAHARAARKGHRRRMQGRGAIIQPAKHMQPVKPHDVPRDKGRMAMQPGKRMSRNGKIYWERRANRADKRPYTKQL